MALVLCQLVSLIHRKIILIRINMIQHWLKVLTQNNFLFIHSDPSL